ncbi:MAG: hypothetical protein UR90_C0009G0005 [Parcubacteria group bacterium GW2011_GWC1_35_8]|uniref:Nudix hydrolase domain-containing protein n=3 Tax=Candidatus Nomuraibacteriota TaxID=1752729 RepID=A0A1F6YW27_9BACT|nr:MAG: hypothetical protein UR90_C0009G0005 [Parcubacteria group bacterium GW2011_GWC1_35_8]KKP87943.1 MAG: hypothetical protein UR91_C0031G0004 [Candidatus Nomurabacteria bacterium GW2011_GWC2_35_8]OGJ05209.1 MAG: hypothetical protein A2238_02445 [Candidatus Nomurabacteria bacterium RIFOXYA2_FULL_35_9]OGJ06533.1 MAG: hypothetical protein A2192_00455 [Candidatus Nomurabacteria bacterium RIFOXYA1_FULL_35_17]OGJ10557.1 MAG: hypothetical protein A2456_02540 [Candidatus Nomurabacteria bacterium RI
MTKKKSVGIQLLGKNVDGKLVAILQVRAKWNAEKNAPETYAGSCQVTVHGRLEEGEDFLQALLREVKEELGEEIVPAIKKLSENNKLIELVNLEMPEKHVITYGGIVEEVILKQLLNKEKTKSFGGFRIIARNEIRKIVDIKISDRIVGITDKNIIAMFPDEKEAVQLAFKKLN